nr:hypothetical protein [uncultured Steroidobacter sp.]
MGEQRRYFPDWTRHARASSFELEADHNSYLAGGYAEEFGYCAQSGFSRNVPLLEDESPELCRERHRQAQATHPGYPLRAHPLSSDFDRMARQRRIAARRSGMLERPVGVSVNYGIYFSVDQRAYPRQLASPQARATVIATRLAAALTALRWALRRR